MAYRVCEYRNGTTECVWRSGEYDSYDEAYVRAERKARGNYTSEFAVELVEPTPAEENPDA